MNLVLRNIKKGSIAALAGLALLLFVACDRDNAPGAPEFAYVSSGGANTITVIDLYEGQAVKTIPVGSNPSGVTANPVRNEIYVANSDSSNVSVIDTTKNAVALS